MSRCTAPSQGHRSASAAANCPACRYKYGGYGRSSGYGYSPSSPYSAPSYSRSPSPRSGIGGGGGSSGSARPQWSRPGSPVSYTPAQIQELTPVRETIERQAQARPEFRDAFLCHAWGDRQGAAKELHDLLEAAGVRVWFSEKDLGLGLPMMRAIDKGLANSFIGLVLVTPALLKSLPNEGVADKELSALLRGNRLAPIVHGTSFDELVAVSPLLASRSGLSTAEDSMEVIAKKIAELVDLHRS